MSLAKNLTGNSARADVDATLGRRDFIMACSIVTVGSVACLGCEDRMGPRPAAQVVLHEAASYVASRTAHPLERIAVLRDEKGLRCVSMVCTHQKCVLRDVPGGGFACPCHGATFSAEGEVVSGPAPRPLPFWKLSSDSAGRLVAHIGEEVPSTARLEVVPNDANSAPF